MTAEVLRTYRYRCDAGRCPTVAHTDELDSPAGWTQVSSAGHQQHADLSRMKASARHLRELSAQGVRSFGRFTLDLCPEHPSALAEHHPRTVGVQIPRSRTYTIVACSCGARLGETTMQDSKGRWLAHAAAAYGWTEDER